jgi:hypothetical protein
MAGKECYPLFAFEGVVQKGDPVDQRAGFFARCNDRNAQAYFWCRVSLGFTPPVRNKCTASAKIDAAAIPPQGNVGAAEEAGYIKLTVAPRATNITASIWLRNLNGGGWTACSRTSADEKYSLCQSGAAQAKVKLKRENSEVDNHPGFVAWCIRGSDAPSECRLAINYQLPPSAKSSKRKKHQ